MIKTSPYRDYLLKKLSNPAQAAAYLDAALEESDEAFLVAMRNVAQAQQMSRVAETTGLQRESLYRSFSEQGNPTLSTLSSVLNCVGLRLSVQPRRPKRKTAATKVPARKKSTSARIA
ncbi:MAG: addiction module antidote protein [Acidobacteriota bacterium]